MEAKAKQKVSLSYRDKKMELIPDSDCEIVHEDGKWFVIRKAEKYPKTYEECCKIMGIEYPFIKKHENTITASCYKNDLITDFIYLLICRDAYWKIAGDWKPDWIGSSEKYCLIHCEGEVQSNITVSLSLILSFPTAEMRDAFYENFKELIEQCKELL